MNRNPHSRSYRQAMRAVAVAGSLLLGFPAAVSSQTIDIPNYPLQSGAGNVPPNIMYILDDSGSMSFEYMANPDIADVCRRSSSGSCQSPNYSTFDAPAGNTLAYRPGTKYEGWRTSDGTEMSTGKSYSAAYADYHLAGTDITTINLADSTDCFTSRRNGADRQVCGGTQTFLVPKSSTDTSTAYLRQLTNYYRYQIRNINGTPRIVRSELKTGGGVGDTPGVANYNITRDIERINEDDSVSYYIRIDDGWMSAAITPLSNSNGDVRLRIYAPNRDPYGTGTQICDANANRNQSESCGTMEGLGAGLYLFRIYSIDNGDDDNNERVRNVRLTITTGGNGCRSVGNTTYAWGDCKYATPLTTRSEADELNNYATWFSYHRTRMKVAKAGSTKAFSGLGDNVRLGYRTIHNRSNYDIPVSETNKGIFEGTPRTTWFSRLTSAEGSSGTPLQSALRSAGEYYKQDSSTGPYGPESGDNQLVCRQNFTILTTDGYWNDDWGSVRGRDDSALLVGDQDGVDGEKIYDPGDETDVVRYSPAHPYRDGATDDANFQNSLADIAMHYWKTDLRDTLDNLVPTTPTNDAFWQHMVTFGVSIGLKGTLDQGSVSEVLRDGRPRKAGANVNWPNPMNQEDAERIDDLLHAAVNGRGEFIAATDASRFAEQLSGLLGQIQSRTASGSNVTTNSTSFQDQTRAYQATYQTSRASGDLAAYDVTSAGGIANEPEWRVSEAIEATYGNSSTTDDFHKRTVLTWTGSQGAAFPTKSQSDLLVRTEGFAPIEGADNAAYIKGDRTLERATGSRLRSRAVLLGDIVNSSPMYLQEKNTLFVGANDGMLHGIDASNGKVLFSYVPAGLDFAKLSTLSDPGYSHQFFVDGPVAVSDDRAAVDTNYLVGTLGRGGKGAFALDVTTPTDMTNGKVLWDHTASADGDMGYVLGLPLIVKGNNGSVLAIVPNGINSANESATLFVYNVANGTRLAKLVAATGSANGLSSPRAADLDGDGKVDYVYAGDLHGNVWKFDLSSDTASEWAVANTAKPVFTATDADGNPQPITGGLALARELGKTAIWVAFGTGRMLTEADMNSEATQTVYAVKDVVAGTTLTRADLTKRTIAAVDEANGLRAFEDYEALPEDSEGWYVDLGDPTPGERVISGTRIKGRALWFSSVIPLEGEGCEPKGSGYLNAIDIFTGTSPKNGTGDGSTSFFDLDGDGSGDNDKVGDKSTGSYNPNVGMPTESSQIDDLVVVCGSDGTCNEVKAPPPPGGGGTPRRLSWRELFGED